MKYFVFVYKIITRARSNIGLVLFVPDMFANARSTLNIPKERLHCKVELYVYNNRVYKAIAS